MNLEDINPDDLIAQLDALLENAPADFAKPPPPPPAPVSPFAAEEPAPEPAFERPFSLAKSAPVIEAPVLIEAVAALSGKGEQQPSALASNISGGEDSPSRDEDGGSRARRILLVEDNKDFREVVRYLLAENAYEVVEAEDGAAGLDAALQAPPDLVLMDYHMPRMNGYELLQELRARHETRGIPVIMFSGATNRRHFETSFLDLCDFLEKPVSNARLLESISTALRREHPAHPPAGPNGALSEEGEKPLSEDGGPLAAAASPLFADLGEDDAQVSVDAAKKETDEELGLDSLSNDSPIVSRVNKILVRAVELGASDIHIEPQEKETSVRVRINGTLNPLCTIPKTLHGRLAARIKIMSNLIITEKRLPQDGQIRATMNGRKTEFRVSTLPSLHGEKVVLRVLGTSKIKTSLAELGTNARDLSCIEAALKSPHGLILVTGPTGSGKSTTLYSMIKAVNTPDVNILTAEDPVEYELPGITQVPVKSKIGMTFEATLRSFLRQDPDIMLIGEIRDLETAEIAVKASITGHLVLSTLHTNSSAATITRLTHMGLAPYLVTSSVKLVIAQRLVKLLCQRCKVPAEVSSDERRLLGEADCASLKEIFQAGGCSSCGGTGYTGRMPVFEVMPVGSPEMRSLIIAKGSLDELSALAVREGMTSLRQSAINAVAAGQTSLPEALKVMLGE